MLGFVRKSVELHVSVDQRYALVCFESNWYALHKGADGQWRPLPDERGTYPLTTIGEAQRRISYHRWHAAEGVAS